MRANGYLNSEDWRVGAQLAIVEYGPQVDSLAVEHPSNARSPAEVLGHGPLKLLAAGKTWLLRSISPHEVAMPIQSPLSLTHFEIEKEEAADQ